MSVAFVIAILNISAWNKLAALTQFGVKTTGNVVSTNCNSHGWFTFSFEIKEHIYQGDGNGGASKPCSELKAGDVVEIIYLQSDPTQNFGGNRVELREFQNSWLVSVLLFMLVIPAAITG